MRGLDILSLLIWLPVGGGVVLLAVGDSRARLARWLALAVALATLLLCVPLWQGFDNATAAYQYVQRLDWIRQLHAQYYLGIDGISLPLIVLTAFTTVPVVLAGWSVVDKRPTQYYATFLILEGLMI
jgi:NADH-quinone oxidoreductase subunit M